MRLPLTLFAVAAAKSGTERATAVGSSGSAPAMTPSTIAQSSALRAIGPTWSSDSASAKTPARLTRPQLGLSPLRPLTVDGNRIEPPVSEPSEAKQSPAAVATPEAEDDAPDQ